MPREFLGSGWAFPVDTDRAGAIESSDGVAGIEESIHLILETAPGERVMRPDFGCGIHDYVFATIDVGTLQRIESSVRNALVDWEPRIDVLAVEASPERADEGVLLIDIAYRVRSSNNEHNMVYPFYLEE